MNITFFDVKPGNDKIYQNLLPDHKITFYPLHTQDYPNINLSDTEIISVMVHSKVTKEILEKTPNLKAIVCRSTGYNNVDLEYCKQNNIIVQNVPEYGSHTVAEFTFALILNLARKVSLGEHRLHEDKRVNLEELVGFDLNGKTLGVIGTGKIGKNVIKYAKAFNMNIAAFDVYKDEGFAKEYNITYYDTVEELLPHADIVTLHTPLLDSTHHLINKDRLSLCKDGVCIVNTSRGPIIDTMALKEAINSGKVARVALDVIEYEEEFFLENRGGDCNDKDAIPYIKLNQEFINMDNVIVTPHLAWYTKEADERIINTTKENIESIVNQALVNQVK